MGGVAGEVFSRRAVTHVLVQLGCSHSRDRVDKLATWSGHALDQLLKSLAKSETELQHFRDMLRGCVVL